MSIKTLPKAKRGLKSQNSFVCADCGCDIRVGQMVGRKLYCLKHGKERLKRRRKVK